jgi:hypothetical protein
VQHGRSVALDRLVDQCPPAHKQIVSLKTRRPLSWHGAGRRNQAGECTYNLGNNLVLQRKDAFEIPVKPIGPKMNIGDRVDDLSADADAVRIATHAAFDDIAHPQVLSDCPNIDRVALVGKGRMPCDHDKARDPRQIGDEILCQAVAKVFLLRITAHVGEGQHGNRRPWLGLVLRGGTFDCRNVPLTHRGRVHQPVSHAGDRRDPTLSGGRLANASTKRCDRRWCVNRPGGVM